MSQTDITETDIIQGLQFIFDFGNVAEKFQGFFHRHIQDIGDILALVLHFEGFAVITLAATNFAGHIDIGQEMHFNFDDSVTAAFFTATPLDIKTEPAFLITPSLGFRGFGKKIPDQIKHAGIGGRIGAGGSANRGLIDINDLVDKFNPLDAGVFSRFFQATIKLLGNPLV